MKVMWLCGAPIPQVAKTCKISETIHEGWLISVATALEAMEDIEFVFVMLTSETPQGIQYFANGRSVYVMVNLSNPADQALVGAFEDVLRKIQPDVVHIWGTEYRHSWAMTQAAKKVDMLDNVVVSIQGMVSMYDSHYMGGIPGKYQVIPTFRDIVRRDTLKMQQENMRKRGMYEKETIRTVKHVIGRTFWDKACTKLLNPQVNYHFNNETLRGTFYTSQWDYAACQPHRIFVSQSHYPIKGFHYLLDAAAILKETYADLSIYVSGHDNAFKDGILTTAYGKYVQTLIKDHHLSDTVHYVGMLSAEEMKQQFLKAEVFVSPSAIENSPNSVGEAMLLGMPVVSSNVGGVSDMLTHDKEGFLYQADAPYLLAYYISQFFENREKEQEFGKNARAHALKTHNKEKNIKELIEIYKNLQRKK